MNKKTTKSFFDAKINNLWSYFCEKEDLFFRIIGGVFILFLSFEILTWILQYYSFQRGLIFFVSLFCIYILRVYYRARESDKLYIDKMEPYKNHIVYIPFIVFACIFFGNFLFEKSDMFTYSVYAVGGAYIFSKLLGTSFHYDIKKQEFFSFFFLQLSVLGTSLICIILHSVGKEYNLGEWRLLLYLLSALFFWIGLSALFSNVDDHIRGLCRSEKYRKIMIGYSYPLMSIFSIILLIIALNSGVHILGEDSFLDKKKEQPSVEKENTLDIVNVNQGTEDENIHREEKEIIIKSVSSMHEFTKRLELGSRGDEVIFLQGFLKDKAYYSGEINGEFDELTRVALRDTLIGECDWPQTTKGILGSQAMNCINQMEISYENNEISEND